MLVISRRKNEVIIAGPSRDEYVSIVVVQIQGDKVRLGIEAPDGWIIQRRDVYEDYKRSEESGQK